MKTIIISDIHGRVYWIEDALSSPLLRPYDKVLFLGDYFDDYGDTSDDALNSAIWLKQSLHISNRIHLYGTHDLWYRFPFNPYIKVSGNTEEKYKTIQRVLTIEDWDLLKLYHYEQDYLITHAGISSYIISDYVFKNRNIFGKYIVNNNLQVDIQAIIDRIVGPATEEALDRVSKGFIDPWLNAGFTRGGLQRVGGIIWLDWNEEFEPIPNINQIVGHTDREINGEWREYPGEKIAKDKINGKVLSKNYCIDTRNSHIGILENGEFRYIDNILLR